MGSTPIRATGYDQVVEPADTRRSERRAFGRGSSTLPLVTSLKKGSDPLLTEDRCLPWNSEKLNILRRGLTLFSAVSKMAGGAVRWWLIITLHQVQLLDPLL